MKKNNNGFTLIELLAIIVILAIIAVITVPLILNVIEEGKLGAAVDSSYGYKDAIEKFTIEQMGKNHNFKLEDKTYTTEELKNLGLKVGGKEPNSGEVEIEKNIIKSFTLQFDKYTCIYPVNNKVECEIGSASTLTITNINLESTSNSITVTTTVKGNVSEYLYKIGNEEFASSDSNAYTFNNLDENTEYEITVKVKNETEEDIKSAKITTKELGTINTTITPQGYSYEKNIRFDLNENLKVYIKSTENITSNIFATICTEINNCGQISTGELEKDKWYMIKEDTTLTATSNLNIIYVLSDGINITEEATINVVEIDRTAPTNINVETTNTENSINVTATAEDNESGIAYYQFSNDTGNTWTELKTTNTHTFENLTDSSYDIKVRVINGTYNDKQEINELNSLESENKTVKLVLQPSDAIVYGGYNWHIIREYVENGTTYQTLLMDAGQLNNMAHCTNDTDASTDCGVDSTGSYYVYSWDKSLIQTYLNNTFINDLQSKGVDTSKIKSEQVCVDPSIGGSSTYSYGGYRQEEVDSIGGTCSKYEEYQIRLITASEFYNLSYNYNSIELPYSGLGNGGKVAKLDGIERLSETDSDLWLYSSGIGNWWSMGSYSYRSSYIISTAYNVSTSGSLNYYAGNNSHGVRPVLSIAK